MLRGGGAKTDYTETAAMNFADENSKVSLDGRLFLSGDDWKAQKQRVFFRDRSTCGYCHRPIDAAYEEFDVDHIVKRSKGGSDDLDNLRLIHRWGCHEARHPEFRPQWSAAKVS